MWIYSPTLNIIAGIAAFLIALLLFYLIYYSLKPHYQWLESWASRHGFSVLKNSGQSIMEERLSANKLKTYFLARTVRHNIFSKSPAVTGKVGNRQVWVYPIWGMLLRGAGFTANYFQTSITGEPRSEQPLFYGLCIEISCHNLPLSLLVAKRNFGTYIDIRTESRQFEKKYRVMANYGEHALQLLDPVMIDLINKSDIPALEFSDYSVVLYYPQLKGDVKLFDNFLDYGLKIAAQAERNFPLGKYKH